MLTTTCFGHCGPSSGHKNVYRRYIIPLYTFSWLGDGPEWPKHVVSIIIRIQDSCVLTYPTPSLIIYNTTGMLHLKIVPFSKCQLTAVFLTRSIFRVVIRYIKYTNNQQMHFNFTAYRGADTSLSRPGRKPARKHVGDARDFNNIETRTVIKFFFPVRQGAEGNSRHSDRNISLFPSWPG